MKSPESGRDLVGILGHSLKDVVDLAEAIARSEAIALITGAAGVGKSLLASHMHARGPASDRPMLFVNMATSGDRLQRLSLLGSDFSHLTSSRKSLLEHPTTVLVKHMDQAYHSLQQALARSLAAGSVLRPGSIQQKPVRCRLIFTFRHSVRELSKIGSLERSLAEILARVPALHIPPLKERVDDLPGMARVLYGRPLPHALKKTLLDHGWPGNLAELRASIECLRPARTPRTLPDRCQRELSAMLLRIEEGTEFSLRHSLTVIERGMIYRALKKTAGHRGRAAQLLGLTDTALRWHMERVRDSAPSRPETPLRTPTSRGPELRDDLPPRRPAN